MFEENRICQMLRIKYPIFQGGMAWIGTAELASAVSNAGGLGIIGAGHMPPDVLRAEIQKCKGWTEKPFGVNIMLMSPFVKEVMQVVVDERVPVVTTGAGNPGEYIPDPPIHPSHDRTASAAGSSPVAAGHFPLSSKAASRARFSLICARTSLST